MAGAEEEGNRAGRSGSTHYRNPGRPAFLTRIRGRLFPGRPQLSGAESADPRMLPEGPDLTIDYTLQVDELAALGDDPSAQAVNDNLAATMQYRGRTVGDIKVTEEDGPVLVYNDGEAVPLEEAFDDTLSILMPSGSGSVIAVMTTAADKVQAAASTVFRP